MLGPIWVPSRSPDEGDALALMKEMLETQLYPVLVLLEYKDRVQLALSYLSPRARARHTPLVEVNQALVSLVV